MTVLTVNEIADAMKLHPGTVRQEIAEGKLPAYRYGRSFRVDIADFEQWKQSHRYHPDYQPAVESPRGTRGNETSLRQVAREMVGRPRLASVENVRQESGR